MGTAFQNVFDAFLARIESDDWSLPEELEMAERDWFELMKIAIFRFKYPRVSLDFDIETDTFESELTNDEIQVLAVLMKHEWIRRCIASWEEIKMLYSNKDFSQANHLDKLLKLSQQVNEQCIKAQATYSRVINKRPFDFKVLAGKNNAVDFQRLYQQTQE